MRRLVSFMLACYGGLLAVVFLSTLASGLYEDGYFVKRFAYNFWHHDTFSWNVADGPVYGMTSQGLQVLGTLLYAFTDRYLVVSLKAALYASLFLAALVMLRAVKGPHAPSLQPGGNSVSTASRVTGVFPVVVGLASAPIVAVPLMGLETSMAICAVALSSTAIVCAGTRLRELALMGGSVLVLYLTRPDAVLIPILLLGGRALLSWRDQRAAMADGKSLWAREEVRLIGTLLCVFAALGALLVVFRLYYGTALPLPFYIKTHGLTHQPDEYVAYFVQEKFENSLQAGLTALPFVYIALHERSRVVLLLLISGVCFGAYHYVATIETMGYLSRFYLPGLVPIFIASGIAYPSYRERRRWRVTVLFAVAQVAGFMLLKGPGSMHPVFREFIPFWIATSVVLLTPSAYLGLGALVAGAGLVLGALVNYPLTDWTLEDDETILVRQIRPRRVFSGLERLRAIAPKTIYHTDMGAPGMLFPEARVVDLDGLLNEDITLRGAQFEDLCRRDNPEAIYVPNEGYARLREQVLSSQCIKRYKAVSSKQGDPLRVRKDLVKRYRHGR